MSANWYKISLIRRMWGWEDDDITASIFLKCHSVLFPGLGMRKAMFCSLSKIKLPTIFPHIMKNCIQHADTKYIFVTRDYDYV